MQLFSMKTILCFYFKSAYTSKHYLKHASMCQLYLYHISFQFTFHLTNVFFSSIGDSMASCNARKKEISENALSTPLTLGSTFKSTQPPSSLSYNNMGDFSRSSNGDQDASVQSIIEKMQTGLEVVILLSDSCVLTSHHRVLNQPDTESCQKAGCLFFSVKTR